MQHLSRDFFVCLVFPVREYLGVIGCVLGYLFPFGKLFRFVSYIGFTLGLHDFLLKFHALYAGPCHMFARDSLL